MNVFVTGTGTDIGKTYVTCGLLRYLRSAGVAAIGLKPVVSGFNPGDATNSDPALLLMATGETPTSPAIAGIAPFRFAAPLSPAMAALVENRTLDYSLLVEFCRRELDRQARTVLIEGVGGVMVPLDPVHTVLDWMDDLHLPVILVAGTYLGSLSHTLSALAALRSRRLRIVCVVVNQTPGSVVDFGLTGQAVAIHGRARTILLNHRLDAPAEAFAEVAACLV